VALLPRLVVLVVVLAPVFGAAGCGKDDADPLGQVKQEVRDRAQEFQDRAEARIDRLRRRIEEVLGQLEQAVPRAERTSPKVRSQGRTQSTTIDVFLTNILQSVDAYWTKTFAASDLAEPRVAYFWVPPGTRRPTACGALADDAAAFYCPSDDTIYVAQEFAAELYRGVLRNLPGERAGFGRAAGDFGVAYVVAHEYAHNLQNELGLFRLGHGNSSKPFELQADCLAGAWGASVYATGRITDEDVTEAVDTAMAVGDFDYTNANHHGTPTERRDAWLRGFRSADPSACQTYVPT